MISITKAAARVMTTRFTWGIALCAVGQLGACSGGGSVSDRPMLGASVAESHGAPAPDAAGQLDFLDALEARDLVSNDDALCAVLMLTAKQTFPTYQARVEAAKDMGILEPGYDRPGREAVTAGDVAAMLDRSLGAGPTVSEARALTDLKAKGVFPPAARTNQGLTGSQLLAVLGSASDVLRAARPAMETGPGPVATSVERPTAVKDDPDAFVDFGSQDGAPPNKAQARAERAPPPTAPATIRSPAAPAVRSDLAGVPRARPEPLPDLAVVARPQRPPVSTPAPQEPATAAPSEQPPPAPPPAPAPPPRSGDGSAPARPAWTPGKPLQKPRPQNQGGGF